MSNPPDELHDTTNELVVPLEGSTLFTGPSNVGKTRRTARALSAWADEHGANGVVAFDFAPMIERDGKILGGRLTQFGDVPDGVWYGILAANAPRAESTTDAEAVELARDNAIHAAKLLESAPSHPRAVFVNDATIPFQHDAGDLDDLLAYCGRAECAVLNAFGSEELGTDDPVSRQEQAALDRLREWADRVIELG